MKLFKSIAAAVALGLGFSYLAFGDASPSNIVTYNGTGSSHNSPIYSLDYTGNQQQAGDLSLGMKGVAIPVSATANDATIQVPIFLSTASVAAVPGDIIVATTSFNASVAGAVATASSGLTTIIGVADVAANPGAVFQMDISGPSLVLTTTTVSVGDLIVSTAAAAGYGATNNSAAAGAIVGTALAAGVSGGGLTPVLLHH